MPGCARSEIVEQGVVGVYHCWGRCVRRAWLCGIDPLTGTDYGHRRIWIRQLQEQLAGLFAVEIEFHAEMSSHLHLVLRTRPDVVDTWCDDEVVRRMLTINKLTQNLEGKAGVIPNHLAPILQRLKIRGDRWLDLITNFDRWFSHFVGHIDRLRDAASRSGRLWVRGVRQCAVAFLS